jgi:hypothetical protein
MWLIPLVSYLIQQCTRNFTIDTRARGRCARTSLAFGEQILDIADNTASDWAYTEVVTAAGEAAVRCSSQGSPPLGVSRTGNVLDLKMGSSAAAAERGSSTHGANP